MMARVDEGQIISLKAHGWERKWVFGNKEKGHESHSKCYLDLALICEVVGNVRTPRRQESMHRLFPSLFFFCGQLERTKALKSHIAADC